MTSVFNYDNPALFLRDAWMKKRVFNQKFTLRAWAKQLGITSFGTLHQMINGERPIPKKYVVPISKQLNLSAKESLYFETLIDFKKAKSMKLKEHYALRLKNLSPGKKLSVFEIESFHCLKNPLNGAIIEMTTMADFQADPQWIKSRLSFEADLRNIKNSLELLQDLNLLSTDDSGKLRRTHAHLYTEQDVQRQALREYHKNLMSLAASAMDTQAMEEREFNATAMGIRKKDLPEMKEFIREFMNEFIARFETPAGEAEEIYQLSTQLFGLTNKKEKLQ